MTLRELKNQYIIETSLHSDLGPAILKSDVSTAVNVDDLTSNGAPANARKRAVAATSSAACATVMHLGNQAVGLFIGQIALESLISDNDISSGRAARYNGSHHTTGVLALLHGKLKTM